MKCCFLTVWEQILEKSCLIEAEERKVAPNTETNLASLRILSFVYSCKVSLIQLQPATEKVSNRIYKQALLSLKKKIQIKNLSISFLENGVFDEHSWFVWCQE